MGMRRGVALWFVTTGGCAMGLAVSEDSAISFEDGASDAAAPCQRCMDGDEGAPIEVEPDAAQPEAQPDAAPPPSDAGVLPPDADAAVAGDAGSESLHIPGVHFMVVPGLRYLGEASDGTVVATATSAGRSETFSLDDEDGGQLESGDTVRVRAASGGFLEATDGGGSTLLVGVEHPAWQAFRVVRKSGAGLVANGDIVGLEAVASGRWVSAENGGGSKVFAYGGAMMVWEELAISGLP
jgi:hypothetical protein